MQTEEQTIQDALRELWRRPQAVMFVFVLIAAVVSVVYAGLRPVPHSPIPEAQIADENRLALFGDETNTIISRILGQTSCSLDGEGVALIGDSIVGGILSYFPNAYEAQGNGASTPWYSDPGSVPVQTSTYQEYQALLNRTDISIAMIGLGTNDCGGIGLDTFESRIRTMVGQLDDAGIRVILSTLPSGYRDCAPTGGLEQWNERIQTIANTESNVVGVRDASNIELEPGDVHPNPAGYRDLAGRTVSALEPFCGGTPVTEPTSNTGSSGTSSSTGSGTSSSAGPGGQCEKFGVNLLIGPETPDDYNTISGWGMKYFLHALQGDPAEVPAAVSAINNSGLTGVLRFCYADEDSPNGTGLVPNGLCKIDYLSVGGVCEAGNAAGNIINDIASQTDAEFIAAPLNEIVSESWGTGPAGPPERFRNAVEFQRCFANTVRNGAGGNKVIIASPTFNLWWGGAGEPGVGFTQNYNAFVDAGGSEYVDMWTFNFYNGEPGNPRTIPDALDFIAGVVTDDKPWGINETGDFDGQIDRLKIGVEAISANEKVSYALFFNALGQGNGPDDNPRKTGDKEWRNLNLTDADVATIFGGLAECNIRALPEPVDLSIASQIDPETVEFLEVAPHWTIRSCEVQPTRINGVELDRGGEDERASLSTEGELYVGLELNNCDPNFDDPRNQNTNYLGVGKPYETVDCPETNTQDYWTAGFAYTGGLRKLPLIEFLASSDETDDNPYTPYCKTLSFRNITNPELLWPKNDGTLAPFDLYFTSEYPGLGRFLKGSNAENIKVPLLGGASGCGIVSWNEVIPDPLDTQVLRLHPKSTQNIKHAGGPDLAPQNTSDSWLAVLIKSIIEFFNQGSNIENEPTFYTGEDAFCPDIPGGAINTLRINDGREPHFVNDEPAGAYEYLIEAPWNFTLIKEELCDAEFGIDVSVPVHGRMEKIKVTGGICTMQDNDGPTVRDYYDIGYDEWPTAEDAGFVSRQDVSNAATGESGSLCPGDTITWSDGTTASRGEEFICGASVTCSTTIDNVYQACRPGQEIIAIGGDPFLRWIRGGYDTTDLIGLSRYIYNVYQLERINVPYKIIHNVNSGIETEWGTRVYDLQLKQERSDYDPSYDRAVELGGALRIAVGLYNEKLAIDPFGEDYNAEELPEHFLKPYLSEATPAEEYLPVHVGGYHLAKFQGREGEDGVSAVDLNYYFPWLGQIPRMLERISIFYTNVDTGDTALPFEDYQCGQLPFEVEAVGDVALDFCDCPCLDGREVCDCISRNLDEEDPLEEWLFSSRTSDATSSGGGFSVAQTTGGGGGQTGDDDDDQQCYISNPGEYECPVLNGECLYGAGVETHLNSLGEVLNAVDLWTRPQAISDVMAPFDGEIVKVRTGHEYTYCLNGLAAGGALWYQGEFNGELMTFFMYHVDVSGLTEGTTYTKGQKITDLSTYADSDVAAGSCAGGPHMHIEIASNTSPYSIGQAGPIATYTAMMGCPIGTHSSCVPDFEVDVERPDGEPVLICEGGGDSGPDPTGGGSEFASLNCLIKRVADNTDVPAEFLKGIMQRETSLTTENGTPYSGDAAEQAYVTENHAGAAGPMQFVSGPWDVVMRNYQSDYVACIQDLGFTDSSSQLIHRTYVGPSLCAAALKFRLDANFVLGYEPRGDQWYDQNVPADVNPDYFMGWEPSYCPELGTRTYTPMEVAARRYYGACLYGTPGAYQCEDNYCDQVMDFARGYDPLCPEGADPVDNGAPPPLNEDGGVSIDLSEEHAHAHANGGYLPGVGYDLTLQSKVTDK